MDIRRNLNDWEVEEMGSFLELLEGHNVGDGELPDERIWLLDKDNGFSVKFLYQTLSIGEMVPFSACFIWSKLIPSKVSFFMWLA